tara:strand:- start:754 stop:1254 length:501 start_codon:yes stop_codon:yes gene_type:complete
MASKLILTVSDNPVNAPWAGAGSNIIRIVGDGSTSTWYSDFLATKYGAEQLVMYANPDGKLLQAESDNEDIKIDVDTFGSVNKEVEWALATTWFSNGEVKKDTKASVCFEDINFSAAHSTSDCAPYLRWRIYTREDNGSNSNPLVAGQILDIHVYPWSAYKTSTFA